MSKNAQRGFRVGVGEQLKSYVYRLCDPKTGSTFYIGKGVGNRVFDHFFEADVSDKSKKQKKINEIWNSGCDVEIVIHRHGLTDEQAFMVESALLDLMPHVESDLDAQTNIMGGQYASVYGAQSVLDVDHRYAAQAADLDFPIALIKVNRRWSEHLADHKIKPDTAALYEMTRSAWAIQPANHTVVKTAAAVAYGIIRLVFSIDEWVQCAGSNRYEFTGAHDPSLDGLIGKHVNDVFNPGAQNPVRWFYPKTLQSEGGI